MLSIFNKSNKKVSCKSTPDRIRMNAIQAEHAIDCLLVVLNKQADPNYIAVKNLLISYMYTTCMTEDTVFKIFEDFCNTKTLPEFNKVPGFNDHSRIREYTGGLVR